jgi:hypothetical protein
MLTQIKLIPPTPTIEEMRQNAIRTHEWIQSWEKFKLEFPKLAEDMKCSSR